MKTIQELVRQRILILDGALGTMIQKYNLSEEEFRGDRFVEQPGQMKGNNDLLCLTAPHVIQDIHRKYLEAGADIPQTAGKVDQTFIMLFHEWFVRMAVPLAAFLIFFSTRARRERLHPETEADEPLMTCAEYDALRAPTTPEADGDESPAEETEEDSHE